jgi:hypothetical protein
MPARFSKHRATPKPAAYRRFPSAQGRKNPANIAGPIGIAGTNGTPPPDARAQSSEIICDNPKQRCWHDFC